MTGPSFDDDLDGDAPLLGGVVGGLLSAPAAAETKPQAGAPADKDGGPGIDHPLAAPFDQGRLPWVWGNLTVGEVEVLEGILDNWLVAYNNEYVNDAAGLIPACWRAHPRLVHELPVIYWAWWFTHHHPATSVMNTLDFYGDKLRDFQQRLSELAGPGVVNCRKGRHSDGEAREVAEQRQAIAAHLIDDPADPAFTRHIAGAFPVVATQPGGRST